MSRRSRTVIPNTPHHVTQRGARRQDVFFEERDRDLYLTLLKDNAEKFGVEILVHTLMTNHVHFLAVPLERDSLRWTFQMTHKRYADYVNGRRAWTGHLWQQRFYSSPLDEEYFWIAVRYILRNPVKAGMVKHAEDFAWSNAKYYCDPKRTTAANSSKWRGMLEARDNWFEWLGAEDADAQISLLRKRTARDQPTGSQAFLERLEQNFGVKCIFPKVGRPKKEGKA